MRRALVLVSVLAAGLSAAAPQAALAIGYSIEDVSLTRQVGRYKVSVHGEEGHHGATLAIGRGHYSVIYRTLDGGLEGKTITARFGRLGTLRLTVDGPVRHARRCGGRSVPTGTFKGVFEFRGEGGHLDFDLHSMAGELNVVSDRCRAARRSRPTAPRGKEPSATLGVVSTGKAPLETFSAVGDTRHGRFSGGFLATLSERREGMDVLRLTAVRLGRSQFRWNLKTGTATVRPPAPFQGKLYFHRHPKGGAESVTGTLTGPTLWGSDLSLAGRRFKAALSKELPYDE